MPTFFSNFPTINYNGQNVIDISKNVNIVANLVANSQVMTPFTMQMPMRSDQLARIQYGDPYNEWITWMVNGNPDPYDWYMDQEQLQTYVTYKYGDPVLTQQKVKYWINNWYNQNSITTSAYNSLPSDCLKYYTPQFDGGLNIVQYNRTQVDWIITTNYLIQFQTAVPTPFIDNEIVNYQYTTGANTYTGNGQVCFCSNNQLNIQHILGSYPAGPSAPIPFTITGTESGSVINTSTMAYTVYNSLTADEMVFYDPVTIFDDENIKNENRKYLYQLPNTYISQVVSELQKAF